MKVTEAFLKIKMWPISQSPGKFVNPRANASELLELGVQNLPREPVS